MKIDWLKFEKIKSLLTFSNLVVFLLIVVFISFGLFHLSKFETVDEHFWKYERITDYWKKGVLERNIKKTHINDKPGVSTAIISGMGLLTEPNPETHRVRDEKITDNDSYTVYDESRTEKINFSLRFPLLLFNGIFLLYLFWIIKKISSNWIALLTVTLFALSPIFIGISQIINPDTLLWSFSAAAIFSYFALLKTNERKFLLLTGLFTGLSLLSKYTANILFVFYPLIFFSAYFIRNSEIKKSVGTRNFFLRHLYFLAIIFLSSFLVFSLLMPAVFVKFKYFWEGTIGSPAFAGIATPYFSAIFLIFLDAFWNQAKILEKIGSFLYRHKQRIFKIAAFVLFFFFVFALLNVWTGQKFIPLDDIRENAYQEKELVFPMFADNNILVKFIKEMTVEFYPLIFSLPPIGIIFLLLFLLKIIFKGLQKFELYVFFILTASIIYFAGLLSTGVLSNFRYSIMLYPLFYFLIGLATWEFLQFFRFEKLKKEIIILIMILIMISGLYSLWKIKPFYFNYTNSFLPKQYIIADAWGYGEYEAAEFLNSLPNAEKIIIWSDRSAICQFIKGKCIRDYKIDLSKTVPDYFVISRRGEIRHKFEWEKPELAKIGNLEYYANQEKYTVWSLSIGGRPNNFVKVLKAVEEK